MMRLASKNEQILHVYFVAKKKACVFILNRRSPLNSIDKIKIF